MCVRGALGSPAIMCASHAVCVCTHTPVKLELWGPPSLQGSGCPQLPQDGEPAVARQLPKVAPPAWIWGPYTPLRVLSSRCWGGRESRGSRHTSGTPTSKTASGVGHPFQAGVPGVSGSSRAGSRFTRGAGCPLLPGTLGSRCQPQVHQGKGLLSLRPTSGKNQTQGESPKLPHRKAGRC